MTIIPIASGKGGVGKTTVSSNLAISLAKNGKQVVLVDLDLGAGNVHITLGIKNIEHGIGSFLVSSQMDINDLLVRTEYNGLLFLAGDGGVIGLANLSFRQKKRLIDALMTIHCDYLILDLGAGSGFNTVDFFLISDKGIIVTAPNMAATLTAYLFLKNAIFRIIASVFPKNSKGALFMEHFKKDGLNLQKIYITKLLEQLKIADPEHYPKFEKIFKSFKPRLIMNMLDEPSSASKAERLRSTVVQYLNVDIEHLGVIFRDDTQSRALASGLPIVIYKPQGVISQAIARITGRILNGQVDLIEPFIGVDEIESGYKLIESEAAGDYFEKIESIETLFKEGAITDGDIIETLRTQQYELNQLRKENRFLKNKILKDNK